MVHNLVTQFLEMTMADLGQIIKRGKLGETGMFPGNSVCHVTACIQATSGIKASPVLQNSQI